MGPKWSVRAQLLAGFAVVLVLLCVVGVVGWRAADVAARATDRLYDNTVEAAVELGAAQSTLWQLRYNFPQFMVSDPEVQRGIIEAEAGLVATVKQHIEAYRAGDRTSEERQALVEWDQVFDQYIGARPKWFELYGAGRTVEAADWRAKTTTPWGKGSVDSLAKMIELQRSTGATYKTASDTASDNSRTILLITIGVGLLAGLGTALAVSRTLTRRLRRIAVALGQFADGDLTTHVAVTGRDEVADISTYLNATIERIRTTIASISGTANQVTESAHALTGTTATMAEAIATAAGQVAAVTATTHEASNTAGGVATDVSAMSAGLRHVAGTMTAANTVAVEAVTLAGGAQDSIRRLGESTTQINGVLKVITGIAAQTNLLALNATIEAARAGDAGKGFAVVAGEVKDLAQETAKATEDIAGRVEALNVEMRQAIDAIGKVGDVIDQMSHTQHQVGVHLGTEDGRARQVNTAVEQVAEAVADASRRLSTVGQATQSAADNSTTARHAAHNLNGIAEQMRTVLGAFRR